MKSNLQIRCIAKSECLLGEGPVWDKVSRKLYWVDILNNRIYSWDLGQPEFNFWRIPEHIGFIIIRRDGNIIGGLKSGLHYIVLNDNGIATIDRIDKVDEENVNIRFNDGMIDNKGRIWCCTMDMQNKEPLGKYFCYDKTLTRQTIDEGYIVANGPALSNDASLLYTVETIGSKYLKRGVYVTKISEDGSVSKNKELLIDWSGMRTLPDGITTDKNGHLWIGEFGGNILRSFYSDGTICKEIALPVWNITKVTFRYDNDVTLYVTSARLKADVNILNQYPLTGDILEVTGFD